MRTYTRQIDPVPREGASGEIEYTMYYCEGVCYRSTSEGAYISQCPSCTVLLMEGLVCTRAKG